MFKIFTQDFRSNMWHRMLLTILLIFVSLLENRRAVCTTLEEQFLKLSQSRQKRQLMYPSGSAIGMYFAVAVPVNLPEQDVLFSYNFEANYNLPRTMEQYGFSSQIFRKRTLRSITRAKAFNYFEDFLTRKGLEGRSCLLRTICEVTQSNLSHNGILGHLINVLFVPSTTEPEDIDEEFHIAEMHGSNNRDCEELYDECEYSLLDLISRLESKFTE